MTRTAVSLQRILALSLVLVTGCAGVPLTHYYVLEPQDRARWTWLLEKLGMPDPFVVSDSWGVALRRPTPAMPRMGHRKASWLALGRCG